MTAHLISSQPPDSLPDSFRPVLVSTTASSAKLVRSTTDTVTASLSPTTSEVTSNDHQLQNISEIYDPNQTVTPVHKYWTLPRNIATATKAQYLIEDEEIALKDPRQSSHPQLHSHKSQGLSVSTDGHIHRQIITELSPPTNAKYLYETENTKYFTLPTESTEKVTTTTRKVIPAPPKSEGIGPVDENGIPLALKSVSPNFNSIRRLFMSFFLN